MSTRPHPPHQVLVLQGGGALGAYQGGVYEALAAQGLQPDWVVGTSIGAINGALIAGNPPERRVARLREFWQLVGHDDPLAPLAALPFGAWLMPWIAAGDLASTMALGIPGFFQPRPGGALNINLPVPTRDAGFYDTAPLRATLKQLVDFDYLNDGPMRCTVCAVDIASGELVAFDSRRQELTPEHIMASGALPPGFPPVIIDGKAYWDGGIYSNTPVDIVMDDAERRDTLCFMVDLWDPTEAEPRSIGDAMARQKDIQYASRTGEHLEDHRTMQNLRRAVEILARQLPPASRDDPTLRALAELGCTSTINIVRLILKSDPDDGYNKDIDFGRERLRRRWQRGVRDGERALRHKSWLRPLPEPMGMVIHELPQED
ncbi:MAG: patatin-like phospholipase family protein [Burkholderiales bacterium]|nr:patatin-like phospholipase family protein [Burkholderiales bacterium]MDE1928566.1 patatin-like phospholipase family protein [Burkholderiales bacterium]MDE2160144.1 patatin-like phospholipase family protein [Burkholderiales bacterium]MDE2505444.1 patatin-like phospholipase family protein [Burkholderiales bacterium]